MRDAHRKPTVAIIGAGAGGLAMGIRLKRAGYDFTIYEKSDGVGGTWRANTYPGAACDVPSHLYSFSFELNAWWSRTYATQPEILAYLERCTDQYGLRPHLRTGVDIGEARWDDADRQWRLLTSAGEEITADVVVSGLGMLNIPSCPTSGRRPVPGPDVPLVPLGSQQVAGRRTGRVDRDRRQRHPVRPRDRADRRARHRVPTLADLDHAAPRSSVHARGATPVRAGARRGADRALEIWWTYERANFKATAEQTVNMTALAQSYLDRKITDPELRAKLTPDYPVGCKRPLISREWFPTLTRPNVRLVSEPITEITEAGVRTADGEEHAVDTIVYGTGFVRTNTSPLSTSTAPAVGACATTGATAPRRTSVSPFRAIRISFFCTARTPTA